MKTFTVTSHNANLLVQHLKWCRQNLGQRGEDWDFVGGTKRIEIWIKEDSPNYSFYVLKHGNIHQRL